MAQVVHYWLEVEFDIDASALVLASPWDIPTVNEVVDYLMQTLDPFGVVVGGRIKVYDEEEGLSDDA